MIRRRSLDIADDRLGGTAASSMSTGRTKLTSSGSMLYASSGRDESVSLIAD